MNKMSSVSKDQIEKYAELLLLTRPNEFTDSANCVQFTWLTEETSDYFGIATDSGLSEVEDLVGQWVTDWFDQWKGKHRFNQ